MANKSLGEREQTAIRQVFERAMTDESVRSWALTDPRGVVKEVGGVDLPANFKLVFVDKKENVDGLVIIPPAGRELNLGDVPDEDRRIFGPTLERAIRDPQFRALAVRDPRAAIKQASGADLPEHVTIQFYDQAPDVDLALVLPPTVPETAELNEQELATVAGGVMESAEKWCLCTSCCCTC